jgi:hypothetical protein
MKLSSRKELLKEPSLLLKEIKKSLNEDLGSFKEAGLPDGFSKYLLKTVAVRHDVDIKPFSGKPTAGNIRKGDLFISVTSPTSAIAVFGAPKGGFDLTSRQDAYYRIDYSDADGGKVKWAGNLSAASKGMTKNMFKIENAITNSSSFYRNTVMRLPKPTPDQIKAASTSDPLAGSDKNIYAYMNDTFMKALKPKLESMIDEIYANLRKLNSNPSGWGRKSEQENAISLANSIQSIIDQGFTTKTMESFLSSLNKPEYKPVNGFASIPQNEKKLKDVLKNIPNARAKWAKSVLDSAKWFHERMMDMVNKSQK